MPQNENKIVRGGISIAAEKLFYSRKENKTKSKCKIFLKTQNLHQAAPISPNSKTCLIVCLL